MALLTHDFFARDTLEVARDLIGAVLSVGNCSGRIVEAEAYKVDPASHAVIRRNQARVMWETHGCVYVYFTYGMYHCLNFTTEADGAGAVLVRAAEPLRGLSAMARRRGTDELRDLARGPGRLCQAFGIDLSFNGKPIGRQIRLADKSSQPPVSISTRIGISQATDLEWRFYESGSRFVSGPGSLNRNGRAGPR